MSGTIKIVKKEGMPAFPFDATLARIEARNVEKLFTLHLSRCDCSATAMEISNIFNELGEAFAKKSLALKEKV